MNNKKILAQPASYDEVETALRYYCKFHLTKEDLEAVPELKKYIDETYNGKITSSSTN